MRILVFSWRDPKHPLAGGAEQVMHEHAKGWITAGHKVTLFASKVEGLDNLDELDGVEIIRRGYQYWGVQFAGFFHYLKNRREYDFVVDQFHGIPFFSPLYVRKPKLAVIQEPAREVWFLNPLPWPLNWVVSAIGYMGEPFVFQLYRWTPFMTGSQSAKEEVASFGIPKKNISVIPHGVLLEKTEDGRPHFAKATRGKQKTVMFLGVLTKDKGIEDALKAFALLDKKAHSTRPARSGQNLRFWVVGKAETEKYFNRLKRLVEHLGLKGRVKFWGFVDQKKKFELLSKTHVLVNPSVREGWGLVNIEANAMGTPVVAYRSPGLVDSVKDGQSGILVKKNTPAEMAREVFNLLNNEETYQRLQKGALAWSKNFSWEKSRKLSLALIEKISQPPS